MEADQERKGEKIIVVAESSMKINFNSLHVSGVPEKVNKYY